MSAEQSKIKNESGTSEMFDASSAITDVPTPPARNKVLFDEQYHTDSHSDGPMRGQPDLLFDEQHHSDSHSDGPMRSHLTALFDEQYHTDSHSDGPMRGWLEVPSDE